MAGLDAEIIRKAEIANFFATWISLFLLILFNVVDRYFFDFGLSYLWQGLINFGLFFLAFVGIRQIAIFIEGTRTGKLDLNKIAYIRLAFIVISFVLGVYFFLFFKEISGIGIFFAAFYLIVASDVYFGYLKDDSDSWTIFVVGFPWSFILTFPFEVLNIFRIGIRGSNVIYLASLVLNFFLIYFMGFWIEAFLHGIGFPWLGDWGWF